MLDGQDSGGQEACVSNIGNNPWPADDTLISVYCQYPIMMMMMPMMLMMMTIMMMMISNICNNPWPADDTLISVYCQYSISLIPRPNTTVKTGTKICLYEKMILQENYIFDVKHYLASYLTVGHFFMETNTC